MAISITSRIKVIDEEAAASGLARPRIIAHRNQTVAEQSGGADNWPPVLWERQHFNIHQFPIRRDHSPVEKHPVLRQIIEVLWDQTALARVPTCYVYVRPAVERADGKASRGLSGQQISRVNRAKADLSGSVEHDRYQRFDLRQCQAAIAADRAV
jgi:hypothetical protein